MLTSDGYPAVAAATAERWLADTHAAGALWIADEVQGGHGRTGEAMWSFARLGLAPDVVTLGKPMGNGHPVGAVVTRREIAATFAEETVFFSTFGGNPVSAAAALAVLDVIEDERVLARTTLAGAALRDALRAASDGDPRIIEVRGVGLAIGVQCRDDVSGDGDQGRDARARRAHRHDRPPGRCPEDPSSAGVHRRRRAGRRRCLRGDPGGPFGLTAADTVAVTARSPSPPPASSHPRR